MKVLQQGPSALCAGLAAPPLALSLLAPQLMLSQHPQLQLPRAAGKSAGASNSVPSTSGQVCSNHQQQAQTCSATTDIQPQTDVSPAGPAKPGLANGSAVLTEQQQQQSAAAVTVEPPALIAAATAASSRNEAAAAAGALDRGLAEHACDGDSIQHEGPRQQLQRLEQSEQQLAGQSRSEVLQQFSAVQQMCAPASGEGTAQLEPHQRQQQQRQGASQSNATWAVAAELMQTTNTAVTAAAAAAASGGGGGSCSSDEDDAAAALVMLCCGTTGLPPAAPAAGTARSAAVAAQKRPRAKAAAGRTAQQQQQSRYKVKHMRTGPLQALAAGKKAAAVHAPRDASGPEALYEGWVLPGASVAASSGFNTPGVWGSEPWHESRKQQQQHTAAGVVGSLPSTAAEAAVAAAHAAGAQPLSAALLLQKVQKVLENPCFGSLQDSSAAATALAPQHAAGAEVAWPQATSAQGAARQGVEPTSPCQLLAAAAAPWYPYQGKRGGLMLLRGGRLVARKLYALPTGDTEGSKTIAAQAEGVDTGRLAVNNMLASGSKRKGSCSSAVQLARPVEATPGQQQQQGEKEIPSAHGTGAMAAAGGVDSTAAGEDAGTDPGAGVQGLVPTTYAGFAISSSLAGCGEPAAVPGRASADKHSIAASHSQSGADGLEASAAGTAADADAEDAGMSVGGQPAKKPRHSQQKLDDSRLQAQQEDCLPQQAQQQQQQQQQESRVSLQQDHLQQHQQAQATAGPKRPWMKVDATQQAEGGVAAPKRSWMKVDAPQPAECATVAGIGREGQKQKQQKQKQQRQPRPQAATGPQRPWMKLTKAQGSAGAAAVGLPAVQLAAGGLHVSSALHAAGYSEVGAVPAACVATPAAAAAAATAAPGMVCAAPAQVQASAGPVQAPGHKDTCSSQQPVLQQPAGATTNSSSINAVSAGGAGGPATLAKNAPSSSQTAAMSSKNAPGSCTGPMSSASAAVAASRARLLAALGADDEDDVTPAAAPQAAAAAAAGGAASGAGTCVTAQLAPAAQQIAAAGAAPAAAAAAVAAEKAASGGQVRSQTAVHQLASCGVPMYLQAGAGAGGAVLLPVMQLGPLQAGYLSGAGLPGVTHAAMMQRLFAQQQLQLCLQQRQQQQQVVVVAGQGARVNSSAAGAGSGRAVGCGLQQRAEQQQ